MKLFDLRQWNSFKSAGGNLNSPVMIDHVAIHSQDVRPEHTLFVALPGLKTDGHAFIKDAAKRGAACALVKESYCEETPASMMLLKVANPLHALQEIAGCYRRQLKAMIVGITGSYGKTTTKDLLTHLLRSSKQVAYSPESFNSQLGVALALLRIEAEHEIALIEMGISEQSEMDRLIEMVHPDHAILTTIERAHIETLGSIETIIDEKIKLITSIGKNGWALIPDFVSFKQRLASLNARLYQWNQPHVDLPQAELIMQPGHPGIRYEIRFPDQTCFSCSYSHGFSCLTAVINRAIKSAWLLGVSSEAICEALSNYIPEPRHTEIWQSPVGATFINDCYGADPLSIQSSLELLKKAPSNHHKVFIFGGLTSHKALSQAATQQIAESISKSNVDLLVLTDPHPSALLLDALTALQQRQQIISCPDRKSALHHLRQTLGSNVTILFKGQQLLPLQQMSQEFTEGLGDSRLTIHLDAVRHNVEMFRNHLPPKTRLMAMVKAAAYGTNSTILSRFLSRCGVDILGLAHVNEAITLRLAGITQALFVIHCAQYEIPQAVHWGLEISVDNLDFVHAVQAEAAAQNKLVKVHLHVDTGMSRLGCRPEEALQVGWAIARSSHLQFEGVMTHFACSDDPKKDCKTLEQAERFREVCRQFEKADIAPQWRHTANTGGTLRFQFDECNMARIGLGLYGIYPSEASRSCLDLQPALTLTSRIASIHLCKKGETISYGETYTITQEHERIGVVPVGYFDGIHRRYSNKGHVLIHGMPAPIVGAICMDFMMINLTHIPHAQVNDAVLIFGNQENGYAQPAETFAKQAEGSVYELITCLGPRIQRVFVYDAQAREYILS